MDEGLKYQGYTVEDFVQDSDFRQWVISPSDVLNCYWITIQEKYPEKKELISLARQIVKAIIVEEVPVDENEYRESLDDLKKYISETKTSHRNVLFKITNTWSRIAAVLFIPVLFVSIYLYSKGDFSGQHYCNSLQYIVPEGQKSNLVLADGTKVWLNSGTTLTVSANNPIDARKVFLKGEAYFEVAKDKAIPFLVETKDYTVKVYGTSFNVTAYDHLKTSEIILKEGSISILTQSNEEIKMLPRQRMLLNSDKKYTVFEVDPGLYTDWKNNVLKIDNEKLQDLIVRMEHWYGVRIHVNNIEKVKDLRYTLTIKAESLKEMLALMNYAIPFKYKIDGEDIYLNYNITN